MFSRPAFKITLFAFIQNPKNINTTYQSEIVHKGHVALYCY